MSMSKRLVNQHPKDFERYKCKEKSNRDNMEDGTQPCKKQQKVHPNAIMEFFISKTYYKR